MNFIPLTDKFHFEILESHQPYPEHIENIVIGIWKKALSDESKRLENNRVLSFQGMTQNKLSVIPVDYKYFYAQYNQPELFEILKLNLIGVTGILHCKHGFVIGRRSANVLQEAKKYEFVPSGSLSFTSINVLTGSLNTQIISELVEEVGITEDCLESIRVFGYLFDDKSHVVDLCYFIRTTMDFATIYKKWNKSQNDEYDKLIVIPRFCVQIFAKVFGFKLSISSRKMASFLPSRVSNA
jgi:hypothetical protein